MTRKIRGRALRAFTLIELLVVIAIIAILAAILFPVFSTVRESARQSSAMSNMHAVYLGARLFYEDEGRYPSSLFGYAEKPTGNTTPLALAVPAKPGDTNITPMDNATGSFATDASTGRSLNKGYLYREQVKDFSTFYDSVEPASRQQNGKTQMTAVVYPATLPLLADSSSLAGQPVKWTASSSPAGGCGIYGDTDLPADPSYQGVNKMFYKMDSMDIGPAVDVDANGNAVVRKDGSGNVVYELHYSPDWTKERYDPKLGCDGVAVTGAPVVSQLKYKNPPTERTILTYNTDHIAYSGSGNVLILLMSGTARTMNYKQAFASNSNITLPLNYR